MVAVSSLAVAVDRGGDMLRAGARTIARLGGRGTRRPVGAGVEDARRADGRAARTGCGRGDPGPPVSFVTAVAAGLPPMRLAYQRQGTGEPLVLLHGLGLNRHTWDAVVPALARERDVITIDLPGFGMSPDWPADVPRDLPMTARVLGAAFAALGVRRPHVAGHSLGGLIALTLGQAGLARSVTALAPAGFWNQAERRYAFAVLATARRIARTMPAQAAERLSATTAGRAVLSGMLYGDPARCPPGAVVTCLNALRDAAGFDATLRAGRVPGLFSGRIPDTPVTIVWGTDDRILLPRQAERAVAALPGARLIWLPGCGHVPMNDAPQAVAEVMLEATEPAAGQVPARRPVGSGTGDLLGA